MQSKFPRLFSFAKNKKIYVLQFLSNNNLQSQFHLPLSEQEYQRMQYYIQSIQVQQDTKDSWHYIWGSSIHLLNSTKSPTEMFNPLLLFCGFGTQNPVTNLKSSPGS